MAENLGYFWMNWLVFYELEASLLMILSYNEPAPKSRFLIGFDNFMQFFLPYEIQQQKMSLYMVEIFLVGGKSSLFLNEFISILWIGSKFTHATLL